MSKAIEKLTAELDVALARVAELELALESAASELNVAAEHVPNWVRVDNAMEKAVNRLAFHFVPIADCDELGPGHYICDWVDDDGHGTLVVVYMSPSGLKPLCGRYGEAKSVLHHGSTPVLIRRNT